MSALQILKKKIEDLNLAGHVKIRLRPLSNGSCSVFLDYVNNGERVKKMLGLRLTGQIGDRTADLEKLEVARLQRDEFEREIYNRGHSLKMKTRSVAFLVYYRKVAASKATGAWEYALQYYEEFSKGVPIDLQEVTTRYCQDYADWLEQQSIAKSTAQYYFRTLKTALNQAVKDELLALSPARTIAISYRHKKREFLTLEEIETLKVTPERRTDVTDPFLFACYTGLRYSDLQNLKFSDIKGEHVYITQKKTDEPLRVLMIPEAREILDRQPRTGDLIFRLPDPATTNRVIHRWARRAGIDRPVTFHSSRHSMATNLLSAGVDLPVVSKLLGHTDIKTTMIYAKVVDKLMDDGIKNLSKRR